MSASYEEGANFMLWGRMYPLTVTNDPSAPSVAFEEGRGFAMRPDCAGSGFETFLRWYTRTTEDAVREILPPWAKRLGLRPRSAAVRYARTRWGSCTRRGDLMFNSRLSMLSRDVVEYVVVHELCHLVHLDHSKNFWRTVASALPDCVELRKKLRREERDAVL